MSFQNARIVSVGADAEAYHGNKGERGSREFKMSPSALKGFYASPSKWIRGYNLPDSGAKDWGNLLDVLLLTPQRFDSLYAVQPATYETTGMECPSCKSVTDSGKCAKCKVARVEKTVTKDWDNNSNTCGDWVAAQKENGRDVVRLSKVEECRSAIARLKEDSILSAWHDASDTQVHVRGEWNDEKTGLIIPVECLIDYVPRRDTEFAGALGDLKTTTNASLQPFSRWCHTAGYHVQAGFDLDLFNCATDEERTDWVFILSENYAPYEPGRRLLSQDRLDIGRQFYKSAMARYAQCLKSNRWPGYDDHKDAAQGWSVIHAEPWMAFEAQSMAMEADQDAATEEETFDVVP